MLRTDEITVMKKANALALGLAIIPCWAEGGGLWASEIDGFNLFSGESWAGL